MTAALINGLRDLWSPHRTAVRLEQGEEQIPEWLGKGLWRLGLVDLLKGAGHKYLRRVPTGNPKRPWRYYYKVSGGRGIGHRDELRVGAAFKIRHAGQDGHFHIIGVSGDQIRVRHDETGHEAVFSAKVLQGLLRKEHATAIEAHRTRLKRDIAAAKKHGTKKQQARLKAEAERLGHHDLVAPKLSTKAGPGLVAIKLKDKNGNLTTRWVLPENVEFYTKGGDAWLVTEPPKDSGSPKEEAFSTRPKGGESGRGNKRLANPLPEYSDVKISVTLDENRPPDFTHLKLTAFEFEIDTRGRFDEYYPDLHADQWLKETDFWGAVGSSWAQGFLLSINAKGGYDKASYRMRELYGRTAKSLTEWWSHLTDEERQYFWDNYVDQERQPSMTGAIDDERHNNDKLKIPPGMEKMKAKGWKLHPYQAKAVNFTVDHAPRALLAMEMGLGKTLTAVTTFHTLKAKGEVDRMIVTAPLSAHGSWEEHFSDLSDARVAILGGVSKKKRLAAYEQFKRGEIDVIVITPDTLATKAKAGQQSDADIIEDIVAEGGEKILRVADEVHKFKNPNSARSEGFWRAISDHPGRVIGMTGTPKPNGPEDFYHVVDHIKPGALGDHVSDFIRDNCYTDNFGNAGFRPEALPRLYKKLGGIMFARTTRDPDARLNLPERKDLVPSVKPDSLQEELGELLAKYSALRVASNRELAQGGAGHATMELMAAEDGGMGPVHRAAARAAPLGEQAMLTRWQQLAIDPTLLDADLAEHVGDYESPKMKLSADAVAKHLKADKTAGAVVFSEYNGGLEAMRRALKRRGFKDSDIGIYKGDVSRKKRMALQQDLNDGKIKVLLGNTAALETGANLQKRANLVVHLNTPWAPDRLTQSTGRVYRQGQTRKVTVLRPVGSEVDAIVERTVGHKLRMNAQAVGKATDADSHVTGSLKTKSEGRGMAAIAAHLGIDLKTLRAASKGEAA